MRIYVTGASGFVGSNLVHVFAEATPILATDAAELIWRGIERMLERLWGELEAGEVPS